jgi:hypothetical protein
MSAEESSANKAINSGPANRMNFRLLGIEDFGYNIGRVNRRIQLMLDESLSVF